MLWHKNFLDHTQVTAKKGATSIPSKVQNLFGQISSHFFWTAKGKF